VLEPWSLLEVLSSRLNCRLHCCRRYCLSSDCRAGIYRYKLYNVGCSEIGVPRYTALPLAECRDCVDLRLCRVECPRNSGNTLSFVCPGWHKAKKGMSERQGMLRNGTRKPCKEYGLTRLSFSNVLGQRKWHRKFRSRGVTADFIKMSSESIYVVQLLSIASLAATSNEGRQSVCIPRWLVCCFMKTMRGFHLDMR
jgi:hypothetical protein